MAKAARAAAATPAEPALAATPEPAPAPALAVPQPVTDTPAPEPVQPDLFDLAFAEAAAAEVDPLAVELAAPKKTPVPTAPKPPAEMPVEPVVPGTPAPAPAPAPTPDLPPPQPYPTPQPQPSPQQTQYQPPQQTYQQPPLFSADQATQLQAFYTDWPDVAQATEVMIRGLLEEQKRRIYAEIGSSLAPYIQTIDTLADRSQLSELQGQISDYDTVSGQLTAWTARQPAYLRSAYERVIKQGTAAEVVDMINRYKQDTMPAQAAPAAAVQAPAPVAPPVNPALAAAAARLAPVATKRTTVVAAPSDFDTAFAEFAKAS